MSVCKGVGRFQHQDGSLLPPKAHRQYLVISVICELLGGKGVSVCRGVGRIQPLDGRLTPPEAHRQHHVISDSCALIRENCERFLVGR